MTNRHLGFPFKDKSWNIDVPLPAQMYACILLTQFIYTHLLLPNGYREDFMGRSCEWTGGVMDSTHINMNGCQEMAESNYPVVHTKFL